ncbi:hypothetical protein FGADI_4440 [Fusarium gaditjirri]|uniref:Uncharacterized protein n=1 Tax=Fusarium gaditjirri TaxID=282569 RepID=A0A8H4TCS7_9HYPO|nr:hypothetical protein FGADI_4440 [Fusarium gaditjirri]
MDSRRFTRTGFLTGHPPPSSPIPSTPTLSSAASPLRPLPQLKSNPFPLQLPPPRPAKSSVLPTPPVRASSSAYPPTPRLLPACSDKAIPNTKPMQDKPHSEVKSKAARDVVCNTAPTGAILQGCPSKIPRRDDELYVYAKGCPTANVPTTAPTHNEPGRQTPPEKQADNKSATKTESKNGSEEQAQTGEEAKASTKANNNAGNNEQKHN